MKWYEDKEYREMCEEAEEIQRLRPPKGQRLTCWMNGRGTWFPSQEDLQGIYCKKKKCDWIDFLLNFSEWLYKSRKETITKAHMMQALAKKWNSEVQLKLAFVMHELYQKKWNPETKKWEKRETQ